MFKFKTLVGVSVLAVSFSAQSSDYNVGESVDQFLSAKTIRCKDSAEWRGQRAEAADYIAPSIDQEYQSNLDNLVTARDDSGIKGLVLTAYNAKGEQDGPKFFMDNNGSLLEMNGDRIPNINYGTELPKTVSVLLEQPLLEAFVGLSAQSVDACDNYSNELNIVQNLKQEKEREEVVSSTKFKDSIFLSLMKGTATLLNTKTPVPRSEIIYTLSPEFIRRLNVSKVLRKVLLEHLSLSLDRSFRPTDKLMADLGADESDVAKILQKIQEELNVSVAPTVIENGHSAKDITVKDLLEWASQ